MSFRYMTMMEFTLTTTLKASAKQIYSAWLSSEGHSGMTGGEATASDKVGDSFTAWDGYIEGENIELTPYSRILQSWRTSEFNQHEEDSQIEVLLTEADGRTELTLIHSNVPEGGEHYKKGWDDHYFKPMNEFFSRL